MTRVLIGMPLATAFGGAEGMLLTLLRHREVGGLEPHVLFLADGPLRARVEELGVPTSYADPGRFRAPWRLATAIGDVAGRLRRSRPDVVLSWYARAHTVLGPAAALAGMADRTVRWEHEIPWPDPAPLARVVAALPCRLVVGSSATAADGARRLWPHREATHVWPGIDAPPPATPIAVAGDRPVIGIVGRLMDWKGQDRLIEAVALLRDRGRDVTLLVVGGEAPGTAAGAEARLRELATRLRVADRVRFCGETPDVAAHMTALELLVSASEGEPFGIVLVEAMALGVPVLAVDRDGPAEILAGGAGALAPDGSPAALATAIDALLADPARRAALAAAGRERYAESFTAPRMAADVGRVLASVASQARS